ncbi:RagB/SusD family nutrient uptake outer membrane protein [Chitinophaga sp. GCM10012297]|uniref:RagB/SusD family nutrient uptake outer membrane protein n=1 Tax=Chitinophaga chungangae TaxID=2821488 RepID=A0ABS3YAQ6_9BACT|nr:RagB/SusD family nutrient uptake outer membrane protein [Chitinophaga chungangae]MBO9151755.1 RagB/SusD family nutrient uptake outer membrane protein [Chitinophaga chungangae]
MIMKKNHFLLILAVAGALHTSCKRTLEAEPMDKLTEDLVFDQIDVNADNAKAFLYGTYGLLPAYGNRLGSAVLDAATDDAMASTDGDRSGDFRRGWISPFNVQDNAWNNNYKGIRMTNMFLSKIDNVPTTDELKKEWKAEARFLRAFFYFELMKRWGGVPVVGDVVFKFTDNISLPRNTLEETKNYIVSELDAIKDDLVPASLNDADLGRANKGAALALKARVLLYWASPLYNPAGNTQRWADAADAAKDVVGLNVYGLPADYLSVFISGKTSEMIFAKMLAPNQTVEQANGPIGYLNAAAGKGQTSPSQNLVDAFLTLDGKPITDATSGYDPAEPYKNRDPRLDATVLYNGKKWLNRSVETFEGGLDKPGGILIQTKTGYYMRKLMGKFESTSAYANVTRHWVLFRYAEILLSIAEARNEESGPAQEVYDHLILVRKRAGIKAGADGLYGLPELATVTKAELRAIIQNERRIEMAFEEQRFWDIRRWKIAEAVMNQPLRGMRIEKQADGSFTYTAFNASTSVFDASRMYWYPVPNNEMQTNSRMVQNPGWE